jgi:precorrin-3B synthase
VLLILGATADTAETLRASAERHGFIVRSDDPRRSVAACAGAPICASGEIPARALAPLIAAAAAPLLDGSVTVHVSGCPKGCAHAGAATLTLVGAAGKCRLVIGGSARDDASGEFALGELPAGFARLADRVRCERRPDEASSDVLARLGAGRVAELLEAPHG